MSVKELRSRRRHQRMKECRDLIFQIADFDPWIKAPMTGRTICYFCRHETHTDSCVFVAVTQFARASTAYPVIGDS